jgi:hypothetical protein
MKIQQAHYEHMKQAIQPLASKIKTHREYLKTDASVKDIDVRLAWDFFYAANLTTFACDVLYNYVHDTHISTALKQIIKELEV